MRAIHLRIILLLISVTLLTAIALSLTRNTRLGIEETNGASGALTVETTLPNATCQKVLTTTFPFVTIRCKELQGLD